MRKVVLVILILFCIGFSVMSKEEYEGWDKWDEELPPVNSEKWQWHWATPGKAKRFNFRFPEHEETTIFVTTGTFYYGGTSPFEGQISVLFYSSEDREDWKISDSILAIAVFPPQKNKVSVRAYEKDIEGKFKCFESWKIKFKQDEQQDIVSSKSKFSKAFSEWFMSVAKIYRQKKDLDLTVILPRILVSGETINLFPKLVFRDLYFPDEDEK